VSLGANLRSRAEERIVKAAADSPARVRQDQLVPCRHRAERTDIDSSTCEEELGAHDHEQPASKTRMISGIKGEHDELRKPAPHHT